MGFLEDVAGNHVAQTYVPAHGAATATELYPIFATPFAAKIVSVVLVPAAAVTGQNTNTTHINLQNRGAAGSGTTELANYDLTSGNDLSIMDEYTLYAPSTALSVAVGVVLALQLEKIGTGLDVPALLVTTTFMAQ